MSGGCFSGRRSTVSRGRENVSTTTLPDCSADRSSIVVGTGGLRSIGSPGEAQPPSKSKRMEIETRARSISTTHRTGPTGKKENGNKKRENGTKSSNLRKRKLAHPLFPFRI